MKFLIDTHATIWWANGYEKLSVSAKTMLGNNTNELYVSIISVWEVAIKSSLGKIPEFKGGSKALLDIFDVMPVNLLPLSALHIEMVEKLPFIHRDPFDRLLVAIAKTENMTILTADENIRKYDVPSAWYTKRCICKFRKVGKIITKHERGSLP